MSRRSARRDKAAQEQRRQAAEKRAEARAKLTDEEQLERLEKLFPDGAKREKARLRARIEARKEAEKKSEKKEKK